jgi:hypothetical protein
MPMDVELVVGEEKTITITYANSLDVSGATMSFAAKADLDDSDTVFTKVHADFDMTNAATGVVTFEMDDTDVTTAQTLIGQCTATFSGTSKDITEYITMRVKESVA